MEEDLKKAIEVLRNGGIILYPTDTIWGIGCDATNADAVKRIYELKRRADNKSMLVIVGNVAMAERYVEAIPDVAYDLMDVAVSPLTIIYDNSVGLASNLLGENNSIGIRVTHERFSAELCKRFRKPIVSTSANISGEKSAASFSEISETIKSGVDYVVEYRRDDNNPHKASSIIKLANDGTFKILRP